jgi:hypothetical protein
MTIIGLTSIIVPAVFPEAQDFNTAWLWMLSGLWTARSVYQIVAPQGTEIHGVSEVMTTSFLVIKCHGDFFSDSKHSVIGIPVLG